MQTIEHGTEAQPQPRHEVGDRDWLWLLLAALIVVILLTMAASPAHGVKIADITRVKGQEENRIFGWGLVTGLAGTGDGKSMATVRPYAMRLKRLGNELQSAADVKKLKNVALVDLEAVIGPNGAREGDKLDVYVSASYSAGSLKGGRLVAAYLVAKLPGKAMITGVLAEASGAVVIEGDSPETGGVIRGGAKMLVDVTAPYLKDGAFTLVLSDAQAGFAMASAVAKVVNEYLPPGSQSIAEALDTKNVRVRVPGSEAASVVRFIGEIRSLPVLLPSQEAVVVINERTGDITITGDVEIGPVVITHGAMTISTVTPKPMPSEQMPIVKESTWLVIDPQRKGGTKLADLSAALNELKVPVKDKIAIIVNLHKTGKLYAKLKYE